MHKDTFKFFRVVQVIPAFIILILGIQRRQTYCIYKIFCVRFCHCLHQTDKGPLTSCIWCRTPLHISKQMPNPTICVMEASAVAGMLWQLPSRCSMLFTHKLSTKKGPEARLKPRMCMYGLNFYLTVFFIFNCKKKPLLYFRMGTVRIY